MRTYLLNLLKALEHKIPPIPAAGAVADAHHAITFSQYGSDEQGWEDRLALHVRTQKSITFFLDDGDFEKPIDALVAEIVDEVFAGLNAAESA
jgi:hypothetical protein